MTKANLLVIQGIDQGNRFTIESAKNGEAAQSGIGRGVRNEIRIFDTEVSRQHATIESTDGTYTITDLGSSNGTFVNGNAIQSHPLKSGDQIQCGRSVLLFNLSESDSESKYQAANSVDLRKDHRFESHSKIVSEIGNDPSDSILHVPPADSPVDLQRTVASLQALYRISEEVISPLNSAEQLLQRILDLTIEAVGADRGCLLVSDPETGEMAPHAFSARGKTGAQEKTDSSSTAKMPVSRSIVDYVIQNSQGVRTTDAQHDQRFSPGQSIFNAGIREAMCVPLHGHNELLGVVYVDMTTSANPAISGDPQREMFSEDKLRLLLAIGGQTALAIENNRYQQALVNAERLAAMGQTIAMLSHHIKNILQGVRGGSYLIDMGLSNHDEDVVRKGWTIVEKNQGKIYHLVMDMLSFSKDRQPLLQSADLNNIVRDVSELMESRAEECHVHYHDELAENLPLTALDTESIHRAILNVASNAIDATEGREAAEVCVKTGFDSATNLFCVTVTDNGPGIPDDQIDRIFNIFESTKGSRGTGLGLAVSRKILREHNGDITVQSDPQTGCCFTLNWPRMSEE